MLRKVLIEIRNLLSYAALGFLLVMASQQFATTFYLNATPRPWFGLLILVSAFSLAHRLRSGRKHAEDQSPQAVGEYRWR